MNCIDSSSGPTVRPTVDSDWNNTTQTKARSEERTVTYTNQASSVNTYNISELFRAIQKKKKQKRRFLKLSIRFEIKLTFDSLFDRRRVIKWRLTFCDKAENCWPFSCQRQERRGWIDSEKILFSKQNLTGNVWLFPKFTSVEGGQCASNQSYRVFLLSFTWSHWQSSSQEKPSCPLQVLPAAVQLRY